MNSQQNLANSYVSRFNGEENTAQQQNSKSPVRHINDSDPFRISSVAGRGFMILFYAGLIAGVLCAGLGVILSITPGTATEDVIKQNLMNSSSKWIYDNKQSLLNNFNVQLDLLSQGNNELFSQIENNATSSNKKGNSENKISNKKKVQNSIIDRSIMELRDTLSVSQQRSQSANNYAFGQSSYSTPFIQLENAHFESKIDLNAEPVIPEDNHCLQVKISDSEMKELTVEGLPSCGGYSNSLPVNLVQNKVLKFSEMMKMKMCSDDTSCEQVCDSNSGVSHAIERKKGGKNSHSLDKSFEIQSKTCTATFAVKEICLVFSLDNKKSTISKFEGGCYGGNYLIYDFESKISETSVVLREKEDPVLASIYYSNDYSPYVVGQTQKEKTALILYYTGAGIFALLIFSLIIIRIKEERNADKFTKVSRVTELSSLQTTPTLTN